MVRRFNLQLPTGLVLSCFLHKFTWEDQYGIRGKKYVSSSGELLQKMLMTEDEKYILPAGSTSALYLDDQGNELLKSDLVYVDSAGKPLPITPSMYAKDNIIQLRKIPIADYFCYDVQYTYVMDSDADHGKTDIRQFGKLCNTLLDEGYFYTFTYAYFDTPFPQDAILIPTSNNKIIVAVGKPAEPIFTGLEYDKAEFVDEEIESEEDSEFDFGAMW